MKEQSIPVFGTLSAFGGWSLEFKPTGNCTRESCSGYDKEFPFDRFDVPVVDLRGETPANISNYIRREFQAIDNNESAHEYGIRIARELGLKILNDK
jgi:hypothetical protein